MTTILDAERLGHVDLDTLDVAAVPQRLEGLVREAQVQDLIETHRSQVVIDPVQLGLGDVLVQLGRESPSRGEVVPERFLDHDTSRGGQIGRRQESRW